MIVKSIIPYNAIKRVFINIVISYNTTEIREDIKW